jgi:hypothetical protein
MLTPVQSTFLIKTAILLFVLNVMNYSKLAGIILPLLIS